jgi:hypothetical protein
MAPSEGGRAAYIEVVTDKYPAPAVALSEHSLPDVMNMTKSIKICMLVVGLICGLTSCGDKGNSEQNESEF